MAIYTHICAVYMYIYNHVHTYQMWVNEVFLDRRMTILHFSAYCDIFLLIMGRSIIFRWFFVILTMCFIIFHFFLFQLYARTENYIATLVERHGFQEKTRVPREKSGRHSNLIYLVLKPLKKSGTAFGDLSVFWRCFSLLFNVFLFWRWVSLIFHYFEDVAHYCSMIFHYFQHVFHYFSLIFQCC